MAAEAQKSPLKIVVLGGGTGVFPSLQGLKHHTDAITAIVTVADDGGSSGRLRKDYFIHPPGDIRNCLVALSSSDPLIGEVFSYRFEDSILKGHSFGNLLLAVLTRLTGDFRRAIDEARRILGVRARVIPSTDTRVVLVAGHPDGTKSTGEQSISRCGKPIVSMELMPHPPPVSDEIREALRDADLIVIGPGSLYTSIVPNLLVPGVVEAIGAAKALVVCVANLMNQPGETDGFDLSQHLTALRTVAGLDRLDAILVNATPIPEAVLERYARAGAWPLRPMADPDWPTPLRVLGEHLMALTPDGKVRHDGARLAARLVELAREHQEYCDGRG